MINIQKKRRLEIHFVLGCSDARDISSLQTEAISELAEEYRQKGIDILIKNIRTAGSFVTPDVVSDIRRMIEKNQRNHSLNYSSISYFVHIQTHGQLSHDSRRDYISHLYDVRIDHGSPLNCGMLGATPLGLEIEQMLIEEKPIIYSPNGTFVLRDEAGIERMLQDVYGHKGFLAGDWLKSISYLRTHPREQKARLVSAIAGDWLLSRCNIKITAGIVDYGLHSLIRLDEGDPPVPFWDTMQQRVRERALSGQYESQTKRMSEKQKPLIGLISVADPDFRARSSALRQYLSLKSINVDFEPNMVFQISGGGFDLPTSSFSAYAVGGFYYAVKYLGLTDQIVMGTDNEQTQRMILKIKSDPIMSLTIHKFGVNLIPAILN